MVIHNLVPDRTSQFIRGMVTDLDWKYFGASSDPTQDDVFQFVHFLYSDGEKKSKYLPYIVPVMEAFEEKTGMKIKQLLRAKFNLLTQRDITEEENNKAIHTDCQPEFPGKYISMVYYVNDSDGDTVLFDDDLNEIERCTPACGSATWFDSKIKHTATVPKHHKNRIVINFMFEIEE
jgi:hypothetical protein